MRKPLARQAVLTRRFTRGSGLAVADLRMLIAALQRMQQAVEAIAESAPAD